MPGSRKESPSRTSTDSMFQNTIGADEEPHPEPRQILDRAEVTILRQQTSTKNRSIVDNETPPGDSPKPQTVLVFVTRDFATNIPY